MGLLGKDGKKGHFCSSKCTLRVNSPSSSTWLRFHGEFVLVSIAFLSTSLPAHALKEHAHIHRIWSPRIKKGRKEKRTPVYRLLLRKNARRETKQREWGGGGGTALSGLHNKWLKSADGDRNMASFSGWDLLTHLGRVQRSPRNATLS